MSETGDCYISAFNDFVNRKPHPDENVVLVHGLVTGQGPIEGVKYGHAWIEIETDRVVMVHDHSNGRVFIADREAYYRIGRVDQHIIRKYSRIETVILARVHEHAGPWDDCFEDYMFDSNEEARRAQCDDSE